MFIDHELATSEVLSLPQFRSVQKSFAWRELAHRHRCQLVIQLIDQSFERDVRAIPDYIQRADYGGGDMAPLRAHLPHLIEMEGSACRVSFW